VAYRPFWTSFTKRYRDRLLNEIDGTKVIKPVHILRTIQLACFDWFDAKRTRVVPENPNFLDIWKRISLNAYTLPSLPPALYYQVYPKLQLLRHAPNTPISGASQGSTSSVPTGATTDDSTTASPMSGITSATGLTGATTRTLRSNTMVINENPDRHLLSLVPFNRKLKDLMGDTYPPNTDAGQQICLSFHVKGACYSNCRRKPTHGMTLNLQEKQRLENYIADRLEKTN
jgi:hypothetical protein